MDHLINVSKGHIPNLGALGPLLHVEKFVVVGGGGWVVCTPILVIYLGPCLSLGRSSVQKKSICSFLSVD